MKGNKTRKNGLDSMVVKRRGWLAGEHWYVDVFISTLQRWETLISIQSLDPPKRSGEGDGQTRCRTSPRCFGLGYRGPPAHNTSPPGLDMGMKKGR